MGDWVRVAPYPFALSIKPTGGEVVLPSIGWPFSLNVVAAPPVTGTAPEQPAHAARTRTILPGQGPTARVRRLPPGNKNDPEVQVLTGVAYSRDGKLLFDSTGDFGAVDLYNTADWTRAGWISLNGILGLDTLRESYRRMSLSSAPCGSMSATPGS